MSPSDSAAPVVAPSFKALSDLVSMVCELINAVVAAPKPLTVASLSGLLPLLPQIEAFAMEAGDVPAELGELDEAEIEALLSQVGKVLSLSNAKAEAVVIGALKLLADGAELVKAIKS